MSDTQTELLEEFVFEQLRERGYSLQDAARVAPVIASHVEPVGSVEKQVNHLINSYQEYEGVR